MTDNIVQFATEFSFYTGYILGGLGIIGNFLNILVFTQLKLFRGNRCAFYIIAESIANLLYQFYPITIGTLTSIYGDDATGRFLVWCKLRYILTQTFALISHYTVCFAAVDQFFSTNYRINLRQMCTMKLTRRVTFVLSCVCLLHSIVFGLFADIQPLVGCVISNTIWLQYSTYFFYSFSASLLPIVIACIFGILAYRNVRRIVRRQIPIVRRRLDQQMTAMVLMRVIFFVCSTTPYTFSRIYFINFPIAKTKPVEYAIGRLLQSIFLFLVSQNYTASFYLFLMSSSRFRRQVKIVLVKKCWQRCISCCNSNQNQVAPENRNSCGRETENEGDNY